MKQTLNILSKSLLVFLLVILSVQAYGQRKAPGYMGKRFVLLYDQGISWSFGRTIRAVPNLFYTLQGDVAVSKKYSVGAEYSFRTRYYGSAFRNAYWAYEDTQLERTMVHKIGVYAKMFSQRNGHLAPAGPYFTTGLHFHLIDSKYLTRPSSSSSSAYIIPDKYVTFDIAPFIGGGKQYIVARLVLDVSIRLSLPLIGIGRGLFGGILGNSNATDQEIYNYSKAYRAARPNVEANIIELRFGFGGVM